jgi:hypothetical protein
LCGGDIKSFLNVEVGRRMAMAIKNRGEVSSPLVAVNTYFP